MHNRKQEKHFSLVKWACGLGLNTLTLNPAIPLPTTIRTEGFDICETQIRLFERRHCRRLLYRLSMEAVTTPGRVLELC